MPVSIEPHTLTWKASIVADSEAALLSRLLQKLICQGAEIRDLHYARAATSVIASVEITFLLDAERADLLARQWRNLIPVHRVLVARPLQENAS